MSTLSNTNLSPVLRGPGGSKHFKPRSKYGPVGLIVMVLAHLLIGYALVSGMARQAIEIVKKPLNATIIEEVKIPPPPPPPKVEKIQPATPQTPTPPTYVPPPDTPVPVQSSTAAITAVQTEKATAPPPAPAPVVTQAPPPPPAPARAEVEVACPGYQNTLQAALQGVFEKVGVEGTVKVLLKLKNNQVIDVTPQSGPREYYRYVQGAARRMNCTTGSADELLVPLSVTFKEQ
jgi:protein TonB